MSNCTGEASAVSFGTTTKNEQDGNMKLDAGAGLKANLDTARTEEARVSIQLIGGKSYEGFVGEVRDVYVVITRLAGRDFYDALVRIDSIAAIEVQTRGQ